MILRFRGQGLRKEEALEWAACVDTMPFYTQMKGERSIMQSLRHQLALAYGRALPAHPGKWRVVDALAGAEAPAAPKGPVRRQGITWDLDPTGLVQRAVYYLGHYEIHETRWWNRVLKPGWTVCDIGANFGYYSMLAAKGAGEGARVRAFEPHPDLQDRIARNVALNGFEPRVQVERVALSDSNGEAVLELPPLGNEGIGRLQPADDATGGAVKVTVQTRRLDDWFAESGLDALHLVKMDVEGAEGRVLEGGGETFQRYQPMILIELNPEALQPFGASAGSLISTLEEWGYRLYRFKGDRLVPLTDPDSIDPYCNAIALPHNAGDRFD